MGDASSDIDSGGVALVLGAGGMVGTAVVAEGRRRGRVVVESTRSDCDLGRPEEIRSRVAEVGPRWVFNCAATTDVDGAEASSEQAFLINAEAVGVLATVCAEHSASLVHMSSDYVFAGTSRVPYTEDDATRPISVYGASKLAGESAALVQAESLVVRSSWIFGPRGKNFVDTIAGLLVNDESSELSVVDDQVGCPTYSRSLARALWDLADRGVTGLVHYCDRGPVTWYGFAQEIARRVPARRDLVAVDSGQFLRPAPRPSYSVLAGEHFVQSVGREVESWKDGLDEYLDERRGRDR